MSMAFMLISDVDFKYEAGFALVSFILLNICINACAFVIMLLKFLKDAYMKWKMKKT
jgi:hypothetical protein